MPENYKKKSFLKRVGFSFEGLKSAWENESNFKIQVVIAILVIVFGFIFHLSINQWILVVICIGLVLGAELFNTALENLADRITTDYDPIIKTAKDISAAAVLIFAIISATIGLLIFLPKIIRIFN